MELKTKIIFMGTPQIAADILGGIIKEIPVSSVVTQPDRAQGRSKELVACEVKELAKKESIPVFQPNNKEELSEYIKKESPDLVIVAAFGMILPEAVLKTPVFGCLNVHPSLLPEYRGPAPIEAAILNGDSKTGVTIMELNEKMDEGNLIAQKEIPLTGRETAPELEKTCAQVGVEMLLNVIPKWLNHELTSVPQPETATYTKLTKKDDGKIAFAFEAAEKIERKSRAFQPWPGVYANWNDKKIDLYDIKISDQKIKAGEVALVTEKIAIGTASGSIIPDSLKLEGKNKVTAAEFLRGYPDFIGSKLN